MLDIATLILGLAVIAGAVLAVLGLGSRGVAAMKLPLAAVHGVLAVGGFGLLLAALAILPVRGVRTGTQSFGTIAAVALALAAVVGFIMIGLHLRRGRVPGGLVGLHATVAVTGFVVLLVYATMS